MKILIHIFFNEIVPMAGDGINGRKPATEKIMPVKRKNCLTGLLVEAELFFC